MLEIVELGDIQIKSYKDFKTALDEELQKAAEGFVKIGWLLKQARDTDILHESGYANVNEFAMAEYGIDKSVVSRYIRINDRFSEDGNSPLLKEQYREFGYAKLAIMIQLPEEITEELRPELSKADIQTVKEEYQAEKEISDIEVMLEERQSFSTDNTLIGKVMTQLLHDNQDIYLNLMCTSDSTEESVLNVLAPAGLAIHNVRVPGLGRLMLSINDDEEMITVTNMRTGEKETFSKSNLVVYSGSKLSKEEAIKVWENTYSEPWPLKEEPKEEPPKAAEPKKEVKKPKVTKAKVKKEEVAPVQPDNEQETENDERKIEVVPGVEEVIEDEEKALQAAEQEVKKAEIMAVPSHTEEEEMEVVSGEVESPSAPVNTQRETDADMEKTQKKTEPSAISEKEYEEKKRTYKQLFNQACEDASGNVDMDMYLTARQHMKAAMEYLEKLEQLDNTEIIEYQEEDE